MECWSPFPVEFVLELVSVKNPGTLGWGKLDPSFANMKFTDDIVGLSLD
ncbi:hypothetical protein V6N12_011511, partial [Hibiscus sabdariffa]